MKTGTEPSQRATAELYTLTAVSTSTQPSTLRGTVNEYKLSSRVITRTRSPAVAEGPRDALSQYCTNVRRIALEKACNRGMTFKVI